ncbi:hypothetical protein HK405_015388 [Cladochytrium tenue]|nr:hypothetical protein HK405_015388 [Cladochytrium tenue]
MEAEQPLPPQQKLRERIVFAVDIGPDGAAKMGPLSSRLLAARQLIKKFIQLKSWMSTSHEYAILTFSATTFWHCEFGKQPDELYRIVDEISLSDHEVTYFDMQSLFEAMQEIDFFRQNKFCAFDSLYVVSLWLYIRAPLSPPIVPYRGQASIFTALTYQHDKVADDNKVQDVFDFLNEIDEEKGYCLETRLFKRMNKFMILLLAHGQQRAPHQPAEAFLL